MDIKGDDIVTALRNQRNGMMASALDENAQLYAMLEAAKREIAEKDKEIEELKKKLTN